MFLNNTNNDYYKTILSDAIEIMSYDSTSNMYTFPTDGYIRIRTTTDSHVGIRLYGPSDSSTYMQIYGGCAIGNSDIYEYFMVKKSFKCYVNQKGGSQNNKVYFYPLY